MNYGFIKPDMRPEDWVFGSGKITGPVLQADRNWQPYLPNVEYQSRHDFETYGCVSFTTLNAAEILARRLFGEQPNYSDRYLAKMTGTEYQNGNSPQVVAEYLRKEGTVLESDWPFGDIQTFSEFYATPPRRYEDLAIERFVKKYKLLHDYVEGGPDTIWHALQFSPVGVSVDAWKFDAEGYTYKAGPDTHWTLLVHGVPNDYFLAWDTYDNTFKKIRWETPFEVVKGYNLSLSTYDAEMDLYQQLIKVLTKILAIIKV